MPMFKLSTAVHLQRGFKVAHSRWQTELVHRAPWYQHQLHTQSVRPFALQDRDHWKMTESNSVKDKGQNKLIGYMTGNLKNRKELWKTLSSFLVKIQGALASIKYAVGAVQKEILRDKESLEIFK